MTARTLDSPPSILPLYLRAAAPLIPGASLLPFVPGRGREIPQIELRLADVRADPAKVAAYAKVCGFTLKDSLPPTYPHLLAFPLHMAVMANGSFPFGAVGLVHVQNRIIQRRPIAIGEPLQITVWPTHIEPHPRGRTFSLLTEVSVDGEKVWEGVSTMLKRGGGTGGSRDGDGSREADAPAKELREVAQWRLPGDLGRRYASVSGDRNPIHMHSLTAKPLGFSQAIVHGMWSKARCLAALQARLPDAFEVDVRFRKPISLPGTVVLAESAGELPIDFELRRPRDGAVHLQGTVRAAEMGQSNESNVRRK